MHRSPPYPPGSTNDPPPEGDERRIVICGSMSFYRAMLEFQMVLSRHNIPCVVPQAEDGVQAQLTPEEFDAFKRTVALAHIRQIRDRRTVAVLAVNIPKRGISDYIGPNTFAEIAIAFAESRHIYLWQGIPAVYRDELQAWQAQPLRGALAPLVRDFDQLSSPAAAR